MRDNKHIQQSNKVEDQCSCSFTYLRWTLYKGNKENKFIYSSIKRIKYLGIILTKEDQNMLKTINRKKLKTIINGKISHVYELEDLLLWRWYYSPKWYTYSKQSLSKSQAHVAQMEKASPQIHMWSQGTLSSQNNLEKERQSWRIHASQSQSLLQSYRNQNMVVLAKAKHRTESIQINSYICGQLFFDKNAQTIQWRNERPLWQLGLEELDIHI